MTVKHICLLVFCYIPILYHQPESITNQRGMVMFISITITQQVCSNDNIVPGDENINCCGFDTAESPTTYVGKLVLAAYCR